MFHCHCSSVSEPHIVLWFCRNKHIMIDLGTGNNNKINWTMEDKQEMIDIVETVYRGARKGRGLVVSPKDYSTKYRYWFFFFFLSPPLSDTLGHETETTSYRCQGRFFSFFASEAGQYSYCWLWFPCAICAFVCRLMCCGISSRFLFFLKTSAYETRHNTQVIIFKAFNKYEYLHMIIRQFGWLQRQILLHHSTLLGFKLWRRGCQGDCIQTEKNAVLNMVRLVYIHFIYLDTAAALPALSHGLEMCYICRVQVTVVMLETSCEWNQPRNILEKVLFVVTIQTRFCDETRCCGKVQRVCHDWDILCSCKTFNIVLKCIDFPLFHANTAFIEGITCNVGS